MPITVDLRKGRRDPVPRKDYPDKPDARRARLTAEIAAQLNATVTRGRQTQRALARAYSHASSAAQRGDLVPAEALRDYLRAYVPALRVHRFGHCDWTVLSLAMVEMRLLRATQALCAGEAVGDE